MSPADEPRWALWNADIPLDRELYDTIVADMREHAGAHAPHDPWHDETLFPGDAERQRAPAWTDMLRPWVSQAYLASPEDVQACRAFLERHAQGGSLPPNAERLLSGEEAGIVDLRTILDVALITAHAGEPGGRVLEVGGGYGRIAEAMLQLETPPAGYLLVDAVPATLHYAYAYLRRALPDRSIGSYYTDPGADPADFDCFVAPRWHAEPLVEDGAYAVAVNIASFQEMRDDQIAGYQALFDRAVAPGGEIYLCNSRVFTHRRRFEYPAHWQRLIEITTPFAFLPYKPVEIFRRDEGADHAAANTVIERDYLEDLYHAEHARQEGLRDEEIDALKAEIAALRPTARAYERFKASANERLRATRAELRVMKRTIARREVRAAALRERIATLERAAERHAGQAAELKSLRAKARRYERLKPELRELRRKARLFDEREGT